jgi:hypothetical protein
MQTMHERYGVEFMFCEPDEAAEKIMELLGVANERIETGSN